MKSPGQFGKRPAHAEQIPRGGTRSEQQMRQGALMDQRKTGVQCLSLLASHAIREGAIRTSEPVRRSGALTPASRNKTFINQAAICFESVTSNA